jgi:hypothetical protein
MQLGNGAPPLRAWAALLAAGALLTACEAQTADQKPLPGLGQQAAPAPPVEFALRDVHGREVHAADYAGVPLLMEFGACW